MKIQINNLPFMANMKTMVVHFFLLPFANLALMIMIGSLYNESMRWNVAVATILVNSAELCISILTTLLVLDNNQQIDLAVIATGRLTMKYWMDKFFVSFLLSIVTTLISLIFLLMFSAPVGLILRAAILSPMITFSAVIVGFVAWVSSWGMENPYFFSNAISTVLVLVSGNLVSTDLYPKWLHFISFLFPFAGTVSSVVPNKFTISHDLVTDVLWSGVGLIMYFIMRSRILNGLVKRH